ncbi:hypothetical protein AUC43_12820 [Hymenobacter sedentarius]|uniref:DUF7033 domain-containing protein n=1 Tax=Hymenobacter sedentarius TaxID=1411621 RepID=A0A0U4CR77_9BACT|nr:hypothetical protein AUC43_12820 [Hymenobacter sedentarius]
MLPPLVATPVSAEVRLAYVLRHFELAYQRVPAVSIGYAAARPTIEVREGAGDFFSGTLPYPAPPNRREWRGQLVPFFFDAAPEAPLLELSPGRTTINADIIAAAFYLLSGWQEYFSAARDRHGRFPYAESVQQQYGFVALPVVNYYFDVLKTAIEHVTGQELKPRSWAGKAPFAAFISHDIDNLRSGWKASAKTALQRRNWATFGRKVWQHLTRPGAWDNLEAVAKATATHGAKSTFFILPNHQASADGTPNADYRLTPPLRQRFAELKKQGCELGLHGSIGTATEVRQLAKELHSLQIEPQGLRFHYLRWEPRRTPAIVDNAGFAYDSTLGFAEHFGFRNSYCHPFYPFNFETGTSHHFLQIPLQVMDATLHHPHYLQLGPEEILPALTPLFAEIERFGGVASVLWHNENFDPANQTTGPRQFHEIMQHLSQRGAVFLTGREICQQFSV